MSVFNGPLVSIVIPVYNAEKSLTRCLDSVLLQDYSNIEIIIVNDGSTDKSIEICTDYSERHHDIIILVNQKNGGPSAARNSGIELSRGKYISFVDADDVTAPNMISTMVEKAETENATMVICAYWSKNNKAQEPHFYSLPEGLYKNGNQNEVLISLLNEGDNDVPPYSPVRLITKSFLVENNLEYNEKLYRSEDYHFWVKVHSCIKSVFLLSQTPLYYYYENAMSITHNHVKEYWKDVLFIYNDLSKNLENTTMFSENLDIMLVKRSLIALNNAALCKTLKQAIQEVFEVVNDKRLNGVIKSLDKRNIDRFKKYRHLMSKRLKFAIVVKYLIRWIKNKTIKEGYK